MRTVSGRRRAAAASTTLALAATTLLTWAGGAGGQSASALPANDCAQPYPIGALAPDDAVTGLTVTRGTTPTQFDGKILGVLSDGIAPGVDMVIARLSSPEINRVGGIWQGMSGSPVYADDGRLIGAVAYGLAYGASPVAGITPYSSMDDYLRAPAPGTVSVDAKTAQRIAGSSSVSTRQAQQGMRQLPMPTTLSGLSAQRVAKARRSADTHRYLKGSYAAGGRTGTSAAAGVNSVVAGGNLAAALAYGDVNAAGVGTATSVCAGRVVGFGHPLTFSGTTTLSLHPADALYVQEDPLGPPFKVANLGAPVGTITDDHLTGITGAFGATPDTTDITSSVTFQGRSRTGTTHVTLSDFNAFATFLESLSNHDVVVDGVLGGSESQTYSITGTDSDGSPFALSHADRYTSSFDISFESVFDVADTVFALSRIPGVTLDTVQIGSTVTTEEDTFSVTSVQQRRAGTWVTVNRKNPAVVAAGSTLALRALLTSSTGERSSATLAVDVPAKATGRGYAQVSGGSRSYYGRSRPKTVDDVIAATNAAPRNDQAVLDAGFDTGRRGTEVRDVSDKQSLVVEGSKSFTVRVR